MNAFTLPDSLVFQLRTYEARLRKMETLAAVAGALVGLTATFVLLFVFDRFVDTPRWARAILTLSGGGLAAWFAHAWAAHWLWHRRGPAHLAKLLQRHFRSLGDRLQGVIELTETDDLPPDISPALLRAAVRQVAEESDRFDFAEAVPVRPARRWALVASLLAALAAAPFVFAPKAATNALARWVQPWAQIDRYTFASLEALPSELVVPHGEAFEVACGLKADSAWKPDTATARLNRNEPQQAKLEQGRAVFHLTGQTQNGTLSLRVGDATRDIAIRPLHRPEMKELAARIELPAYLGYPAATQPIQGSSAEFLEGSRVSFAGKTSRALKDAAMKVGDAEPTATVEGETFITPPQPVADIGTEATFRWSDTHGLTPAQSYMLRVSTTKDAEPRVELQGIEQEIAILPNEVLKLTTASSDDFGLKESWLGWTVRTLGDKKNAPGKKGETARTTGAQMKKELTTDASFSPALYKIPEDSVVELAAYARDYFPERQPTESWRHTVYVLSPAKHAERIRERMDQVLKQLDERIRDEERQLEETKAIAENKPELAAEKTGESVKHVEASERANEAALQKMTEEMREVMKDALRNKEIPEGTVADWQQLTEQLEKEAKPPMQQAAESLQQGAQQSSQREPQLAKAQEQQQKALDAMRNAAKKMNTTNQNLYARNFYNRMRAAAAAEHRISDGLKDLARETAGLKPEEIAPPKAKEFALTADRQTANTKDVDSIASDMASFVKRVPNEKYETVQKEMVEKKVVAELTELSGFVRANLGLKSVGRARQWGTQLDEWATMLQSECNCQGGGGEIDPDILEFLISMVRAAVAQDNVREQTVLVDEKKGANSRYAEDAGKLGAQQDDVRGQVGALLKKIMFDGLKPALGDPLAGIGAPRESKFAKFQPVIEKVLELTGEVAVDLRRPKTDADVVATQGAIIELLVPPDKKGGKGSPKMQQMMRQMMAQATQSKKAGGNNSKYDSGFVGDVAQGSALKDTVGVRRVEKAGGAAAAGEWPEEFRDQLQAYFQQLESGAK
jgi:histone H3/H4